ncbi:MAG: hypothetical protein HPKKFMNG_02890 [Planctomycetes bacterium]|nr:hypothetical protein [Planctomycetota bacterium]
MLMLFSVAAPELLALRVKVPAEMPLLPVPVLLA